MVGSAPDIGNLLMKPLLLALSLVLSPVAINTAQAQSTHETLYRVTGLSTGSVLNVRSGPGPSNPVIAKLAADRTGLRVTDCTAKGDWCRIGDGKDLDGWVAAQYLEGPPDPLAKPDAAAPWRSIVSTESPYSVSGIGAGSSLNMRSGPGTGNAVIAKLKAGESGLMILDCTDAGDWCEVNSGSGTSGWVATRFLSGGADISGKKPLTEERAPEATRLARVTGTAVDPDGTTTIPKLPPYLLGVWDVDRAACQKNDSPTRVTVDPNGLRVRASNARFKNAIFQDEGYDLIATLMETEARTIIPQRALYRLEPQGERLTVSGDVLTGQTLRRCSGL